MTWAHLRWLGSIFDDLGAFEDDLYEHLGWPRAIRDDLHQLETT